MSERTIRRGEAETEPVAQLSLLDRLIDEEPDKLRDPPLSSTESIAALRRSVRRDLEALLNTRRRWRSWPETYTELGVSPLGYGIWTFLRVLLVIRAGVNGCAPTWSKPSADSSLGSSVFGLP
jgi:type VI secretion system protein ImpF